MLVVLAHIGFPGMGDGVIGVDIFFVISGFVITGILLRERAGTGHTKIMTFYGRRARRIIPMAVLVIAVVVVVDRIVDGVVLSNAVAVDGRWDAMFQANILYFQTLFHDVYTGPTPPPPLAGLAVYWSLSVEEQFYLIYPILLVAIAFKPGSWSLRTRLALLLGVIIVGSFSYAYSANPLLSYASTLGRAWELALGGLLAVGAIWLRRIPKPLAAVMTWAGLCWIFGFVLAYGHIGNWPGIVPLWPALATALVIAGGTAAPRFGAESILKLAPFKWLALWSFSLYLWHKPIYVWAVQLGGPLSLFREIVVVCIAIAVSALSYTFIENPIRHSKRLERSPSASLAMGLALIASCVILTLTV